MIEACPTCLGYVFSEIQATVEYNNQAFWLIKIDLKLSIGKYLK